MEGQNSDFKEMLNNMKVIEYREHRELNLTRKIFQALKANPSKTYHPHYKMTLYCKVIKGLMISSLQLRTFEQKLEDVYVGMLIKNHFEAMKEFKFIVGEEREKQMEMVRLIIKRGEMRLFLGTMRGKIQEKKKKIKHQESRVEEFKYKTDSNFLPAKEPQPFLSKYSGFKRPLQDSRKSAYSSFSQASQLQSKRKFAAIKQLPKMPDLPSVVQQQKQINSSEVIPKIQPALNISSDQRKTIKSGKEQQIKQEDNEGVDSKVKQSQSGWKEGKKSVRYDKQQIIAVLCQLKMLQITHMQSMIQQQSETFKNESFITEKGNLNQSISTLNQLLTL